MLVNDVHFDVMYVLFRYEMQVTLMSFPYVAKDTLHYKGNPILGSDV
jgi:hypothetical protein